MSTATSGATIFYTTNSTLPTHNGSTPTGSTLVYTGPVTVGKCNEIFFEALAYKSGMSDSSMLATNSWRNANYPLEITPNWLLVIHGPQVGGQLSLTIPNASTHGPPTSSAVLVNPGGSLFCGTILRNESETRPAWL